MEEVHWNMFFFSYFQPLNPAGCGWSSRQRKFWKKTSTWSHVIAIFCGGRREFAGTGFVFLEASRNSATNLHGPKSIHPRSLTASLPLKAMVVGSRSSFLLGFGNFVRGDVKLWEGKKQIWTRLFFRLLEAPRVFGKKNWWFMFGGY